MQKVELDLARLDADGLRGPPDGKVSVSYEFCIPKQSWFSPLCDMLLPAPCAPQP